MIPILTRKNLIDKNTGIGRKSRKQNVKNEGSDVKNMQQKKKNLQQITQDPISEETEKRLEKGEVTEMSAVKHGPCSQRGR